MKVFIEMCLRLVMKWGLVQGVSRPAWAPTEVPGVPELFQKNGSRNESHIFVSFAFYKTTRAIHEKNKAFLLHPYSEARPRTEVAASILLTQFRSEKMALFLDAECRCERLGYPQTLPADLPAKWIWISRLGAHIECHKRSLRSPSVGGMGSLTMWSFHQTKFCTLEEL